MSQGEVQTARQCLAWTGRGHILAYLEGATLYVQDEACGTTEVLARGVGTFAVAACAAGAAVAYVAGGVLYVRRRSSSGWGVAEWIDDGVGPLPALCCWFTSAGMRLELAWHRQGGGVYCRSWWGAWGAPVRMDVGTVVAEYPWPACDGAGRTWVAWHESNQAGETVIRLAGRASDLAAWAPWAASFDGADPSLAWDGSALVLGYQHRWSTYVVCLDPARRSAKSHATLLARNSLFTAAAATTSGAAATCWSSWATSKDITDYGTRTVRCAVRDPGGQWVERAATTATGGLGQPGIAPAPSGWSLAWTDRASNSVVRTAVA